MTDVLEKFTGDARSVSLKEQEKSAMRSTLVAFVIAHPVSAQGAARHIEQRPGIFQGFVSLIFKPMPLILIIALLLGGSTSFAAEQSLPGDTLYPVKVNVNEEVRGLFALSPEAKVSWEAERAERRLLEAEKLASRGASDTQAGAHIEENFEAHAQRVAERTEAFSQKENFKAAADVSARFETSLKAHERILEKLAEKLDETQEPHKNLDALTKSVGARLERAAEARVRAEGKFSGDVRKSLQLNVELNGTAQEHRGRERSRENKKEEAETDDSALELGTDIKNIEGEIESESETSIQESVQTDDRSGGGDARAEGGLKLNIGL